MNFQRQTTSASSPVAVASVRIAGCRSCGSAHLVQVLNLGPIPLANRLLSPGESDADELRFPLELAFCRECGLAQITETLAPEILFRQYPYFSSFSDELLEHSRRHVAELSETRRLGPRSLVVELASNDGYLLQYFVAAGVPVLGVEPALNVAEMARARGVATRTEFFTRDVARSMRAEGIAADVVLGNNVLAHVADLNGFVGGAAEILAPDGIMRFEFPYVRNLIEQTQFDTIYHEHLCYLSGLAIDRLAARHGLLFADAVAVPVHGGSLRVTLARSTDDEGRRRVAALLDEERRRGLHELDYYLGLANRVERLRRDLLALLRRLKRGGATIVAYGASAKGTVLMNHFGIGSDLVDYVVDRSSVKQGRLTPGTHLPIVPPERLVTDRPDYALLLSWNFAAEVLAQQAAFREAGGRFIIPIPELVIV